MVTYLLLSIVLAFLTFYVFFSYAVVGFFLFETSSLSFEPVSLLLRVPWALKFAACEPFLVILPSLSALTDWVQFSSVAQSCLILCNPMDHSTPGLPVHQPIPRVYSNSCPLSRWCHPTISSSVVFMTAVSQSRKHLKLPFLTSQYCFPWSKVE